MGFAAALRDLLITGRGKMKAPSSAIKTPVAVPPPLGYHPPRRMSDFLSALLLFPIGLVVGFMNVNAGGGSSLSLPILIFLGLDAPTANGTNRLAILVETFSGMRSFHGEQLRDLRTSFRLAAWTIPGAILGAFFAVQIQTALFMRILSFAIIGVIVLLMMPRRKIPPEQLQAALDPSSPHPRLNPWIYPAMLAIGLYGGFIQVGVGFLLMAALRNLLHLDLVRVNMHKITIVFIYTIPAAIVFALSGHFHLPYAIMLAAGTSTGAWWGAKLAVRRGEKLIRLVLAAAALVMAIRLLVVS